MPAPIQGAASAAAIASLIQQAMGSQGPARNRGPADKAKGNKASGSSDGSGASAHTAAQQQLGSFIASRVRELNPDAKDHRHRLMRVVVEATLLHEFGSSLMTAPKFQAMVDQVLHEMEHSALLQADMQAVLDELTGRR